MGFFRQEYVFPWDFPGKNAGVGCHFLLQGIFPTQGSIPGLLNCRQILYCLSHQGSPLTEKMPLTLSWKETSTQTLLGARSPGCSFSGLYLLSDLGAVFSDSVTPSVLFSSVTQSCPTLCDPMNHSTPGLPVHHQLPEFTQTHVHQVSDAI